MKTYLLLKKLGAYSISEEDLKNYMKVRKRQKEEFKDNLKRSWILMIKYIKHIYKKGD